MGSKLRIAAVGMVAAISAVGIGAFAPSAYAANSGNTTATFTIGGGTLDISVPASTVNLGTVAAGSLIATGSLGNTVVSDTRGALISTWSVTASSTDFTTGGGTTPEKVTPANVLYTSGAAVNTTGTGSFVPGSTVGTGGLGAAFASAVGVNSATWNPTLAFTLASNQVAGVYTGVITQSVA